MASSQPQPVNLLTQLILLVEESHHWEHAADSCEDFIESLSQDDRVKMALNCSVYRERATVLRSFVADNDIKNQLDGDVVPSRVWKYTIPNHFTKH